MPHLPKGICFSQFLPSSSIVVSLFPVSSQFHSIVSLLATCTSACCPVSSVIFKPTKKGPFHHTSHSLPQILGLAAVKLNHHHPILPVFSVHTFHIWTRAEACLCCQTQALYTLPTDSSSLWCSFQNSVLLSLLAPENKLQFYKPLFVCLLCARCGLFQAWRTEYGHGPYSQHLPQLDFLPLPALCCQTSEHRAMQPQGCIPTGHPA